MQDILATLHQATSPHERNNALVALVSDGGDPRALSILSEWMQSHDDWGTRQGAAWAAGQLRLSDAIAPLLSVITAPEEDEQVRYVAALALAYIDLTGAPSRLENLMNHPQEAVRRVAQAAIYALPYVGI